MPAGFDFHIGVGDRYPPWEITASLPGDEADFNLATMAELVYRREDGVREVRRAASIISVNARRLRYNWEAEDTAEPGVLLARWVVTFQSGRTVSYPNGRMMRVLVSNSTNAR